MKKIFLAIFSLVTTLSVYAQTSTVTGVVTAASDRQPLPGVTVILKGTTSGTTTDFDGKYTIPNVPENAVLAFSFVGMKSQEVNVNGQSVINISLQEESIGLEEVVAVGYGVVKKSDVTTSVGSISGDDLENERTGTIVESLTGKISGVQIRQTSGAPGSNFNIRVRGAASITAGNDPLYVIDGVPLSGETSSLSSISGSRNGFQEQPVNPLASLDMEEIESIQILKDASAAAIYGSRGSNGVVLITTKKGKSGAPQVTLNSSIGVSSVLNKIDMMDAYQFAQLHVDAKNTAYLANVAGADVNDDNATRISKGGSSYQIPDELYPYLEGKQGLTNTDWQDEIFRAAITQNHTLSLSGGTEKSKYFASLNYNNQEGIVIGSGMERFAGRLNLESDITDKIKFGIKLNPSKLNYDLVSSDGPTWNEGVVASALAQAPVFPVKNSDGSYNRGLLDWSGLHRNLSSEYVANPVAIANMVSDKMQTTRIIASSFLEFELHPGLTYKLSAGVESNDTRRDLFRSTELETLPWIAGAFTGGLDKNGQSVSSNTLNWLVENTLHYSKTFGGNNLDILAGYTSQKEDIKTTSALGFEYANDLVPTLNAATTTTAETRREQWSLLSYLFRAQYNYNSKYYVSAAIRRDGSSRFGKDNKWGNFPSASLGWRISQEDFLKDNKVITDLKLRASYGVTGNFQIPNYGSIALIDQASYVSGDNKIIGFTQTTPNNNELSWERTQTFDYGLNVDLLNGLLTVEADYYSSLTSDLLLNVNVPRVSGFATQLQNIGEVTNKGFDFTLGIRKNFNKDFSWKSSVNFSVNRNNVKKLGSEGDPIYADSGRGQSFITEIGQPIGSYYGYVVDGIYNTQDEIDQYLTADRGSTQPGDFKFKDLNNDGKITPDKDRQIIGSYFPDFTYGFTSSFNYKNFDFSFALQGVQGNEVLNTLRNYTAIPTGGMNNLAVNVGRWRSATDPGNGITPRANYQTTGNNNQISSYYVENGSYLKVQNITLGYVVPKNAVKKLGLSSLRVTLTAQNPFLFTKYTGYNPEVNSNPTNQLGQGEDFGTYPLAKSFTLGVNVKF